MEGLTRTFNRNTFADKIFQPYNAAVKRGEYQKIDYKMWRKLRDWLYEDDCKAHLVCVAQKLDGFEVYMTFLDKRYSEHQFYIFNDNAFGRYLYDEEEKGMLAIYCNSVKQAMSKAASAISASTDAMKTAIEHVNDQLREFTYKAIENAMDNNCCSTSTQDVVGKYVDYNYDKLAYGLKTDYTYTTHLDSNSVYIDGQKLSDWITIKTEEKEEEKKEDMKFTNFDFGPVNSTVRMSMYGMAIKNASGNYVAYDKASGQVMDVDIFNFQGADKFMYKMPVAAKDVRAGDVVVHMGKPMFVQMVQKDNRLRVLDIFNSEEKTIVMLKSPFGFDFITKVVSLMDMAGAPAPNSNNPFGSVLPFLLMGDGKNTNDLLPMMLMMNGGTSVNPMLMYAMMSDNNKDMLPFLLMMNQPAQTGCCGGHCHCNDDCDCDKEG